MSGTDYTKTPNYGLYKSVSLADVDVWGDHLNANADVIDSTLHNLDGRAGVTSFNTRGGAVTLNSGDVTTALTFTPYNATNPAGYQTAAQVTTALSPYAPLVSPVFTGNPQAPTPALGDADTSVATTAFVAAALGGVPGGAVINPTPPTGPAAGELWWDSTGGQLYVYYNDGNSSQWVTAANMEGLANAATKTDVAAAQNNVGRNLVHNPLMVVAQRGAGPWSANASYTLDRWKLYVTTDTVAITQIPASDTARAGVSDEQMTVALKNLFTGSGAAGALNYIQQPIENVRRLAGKTVTVSFWANGDRFISVGVNLFQSFGSGGSPSAGVWATPVAVQITGTTWLRLSATIAVPSIIGKTLGTNGDDYTGLTLFYSSAAGSSAVTGLAGAQSGLANIWGVQLEIGSVATPLEKPDPADDLRHCQRFYQTGYINHAFYQISPGAAWASAPLSPPMRASPTINVAVNGNGNVSGFTATFSSSGYPGSGAVLGQGTATVTGGVTINFTYTASADL